MESTKVTSVGPPLPMRFTIDEWHLNNRYRYRCSEAQQELADRLLAESSRVCELTAEAAKANKDETDHRLKEKLEDIEFRKKELLRIRKEVLLEIDALVTYKERLNDSLASLRKNALAICQQCVLSRERRLGIDLVCDNVERELKQECQVITGVENLIIRTLEQTQEQIRRLKATLYFMDHDLEDKDNNLRIDRHNLSLKETSMNLSIYHGNAPLDPSTITLNEWEMQTTKNITSAAKELNSARPLRSYIDTILKQTVDDLNLQKQATDTAFNIRILETQEAKTKMELQHSEVMRQANEMTMNITLLEKSIAEKEGYIALAHTRLGNRCQRPGLELTRDLVETQLIREVYDLRDIVAKLQQALCEVMFRMIREKYLKYHEVPEFLCHKYITEKLPVLQAQASLRYLLKTQIQLEEDINIKANSLKIDQVECMTLRHSIDFHVY